MNERKFNFNAEIWGIGGDQDYYKIDMGCVHSGISRAELSIVYIQMKTVQNL